MAGEKSEVGIAWCLDFGGWLHSKFIEGVRCLLRKLKEALLD